MAVEESRKLEADMSPSQSDKKKFADFVRIHAINGDLITRESEMAILKEGIARFGLNLDEANGIMLGVTAEHDIALVSHAEHHIETLLEQLVKKGKISQKEFDDAVAIYKKLTNGGVPDSDLKRRGQRKVEESGGAGAGKPSRHGSRRMVWENRRPALPPARGLSPCASHL